MRAGIGVSKEHLGAGLFVSYDGHFVTISADGDYGDGSWIKLNPETIRSLIKFIESLKQGEPDEKTT